VVAFLPESGCFVARFVEGAHIPTADLRRDDVLGSVVRSLRSFHASPPIPSSFNVFRIVEGYAETEIASVKRFLGHFMSADAADRTFEHLRKLSFIVRPLRKLVWAIRLRRTREAHRDH
jgi:hypothetical protein